MTTYSRPINTTTKCKDTTIVSTNQNSGYYVNGKRYSDEKYFEIAGCYHDLCDELDHSPSIRQLATRAKISYKCARNVIQSIDDGTLLSFSKRGHGREGVSSIKDLTEEEE